MLGFLGTFSINFEIPDYWGIGNVEKMGNGKKEMGSNKSEEWIVISEKLRNGK